MKKGRFFQSLRGQLLGITLGIITFLIIFIGIVQYAFMKDFLYGNKADTIHSQMMAWPPDPFFLRQNGDSTGRVGESSNNRNPIRPIMFQPGMEVSYVDENGNVEVISDDVNEALPVISAEQYIQIHNEIKDPTKRYYIFEDKEGNPKMVVFREHNNRGKKGMMQVSIELDSLQKQLYTQLGIYIAVALIALLFSFLLLFPSLRKALKPLTSFVKTVERTNAENLTEQLPIDHKQYEIDQLASAYNNMLLRIENSFDTERKNNDRMRQFIADASHELRTPITSISGFIEVLQRGAMNNKTHLTSSLKAMEQESRRMTKLVESLLQLVKLDIVYESKSYDMEPFQLDQLLRSMELQLSVMAEQRTLNISISNNQSYLILGNKNGLQQVILNIVQNAIVHTDAIDGMITISLTEHQEQIELMIEDNGVGIPEQYLSHIFERFYRVDKARSRSSGGAGLGLSISKSIVEAHQGNISVQSKLGKGTTFTIVLPAYHEHI